METEIEKPGQPTQTELSLKRTHMSEHRTDLSEQRTQLSDVRSHLSNERTHMSYLRTGIALISFGVTLNRFSLFLLENRETYRLRGRSLLHDTENAGIGMVSLGCLLLVWSVFHFLKTAKAIDNLDFKPAKWSIIAFSSIIIITGTYATVWMILE